MSGYLQCLIDQYARKAKSSLIPSERNIYNRILTDLIGLQQFCESNKKVEVKDTPKKRVALDFVGTIPEFMEYLKNLKLKEDLNARD